MEEKNKAIDKKTIITLYQEFVSEMDSSFTSEKNLELFNFISHEHLSVDQLNELKEFQEMRRLFFEMFTLATQSDTSFKTSRLILNVFLDKMKQLFDENEIKILILQLNESIPRFFKNLVLGKHSNYRGLAILDLIQRFDELFGDILILPKTEEIKKAIQDHIQKHQQHRFITLGAIEEKIKNNKKPIILDTSFILYQLQNEKESFYNLLEKSYPYNCFIISWDIFNEIILHFEFLDYDFINLINLLWICFIEKEQILELRKEILEIEEFKSIYEDHDHYSFLNDLSLIVLSRYLQNYQSCAISRDLNLLKMLNHYNILCNTKLDFVLNSEFQK